MNSIGLFIKQERLKQNMSQEALAEGICSNTYLSKIESGFNNANEEIIELLVEALGFNYNTKDDAVFIEYRDMIWEKLFRFDLKHEDYVSDLIDVLDAMRFSRYSMDVYLLQNLILVLLHDTVYDDFFEIDQKHMSLIQQYYHASITSIYNYNVEKQERVSITIQDDIGFTSYYRTSQLFLDGLYRQAIQMAEKTYLTFANNGNVMGMINISFLESSSYSNLNDNETHIMISERIRRLNVYAQKEDVEYSINYNLGSSYLVQGEFDKSECYLLKCIESSFENGSNLTYEKIILLYLLKEDFKKAEAYLNEIQENGLSSYKLLTLMLETHNDLTDTRCIKELEKCYSMEYKKHHGRQMLFGTLLYNAYRSSYQYPKALKIMESMNYNEIPLFFKK